jgi:hypothetical protein
MNRGGRNHNDSGRGGRRGGGVGGGGFRGGPPNRVDDRITRADVSIILSKNKLIFLLKFTLFLLGCLE